MWELNSLHVLSLVKVTSVAYTICKVYDRSNYFLLENVEMQYCSASRSQPDFPTHRECEREKPGRLCFKF